MARAGTTLSRAGARSLFPVLQHRICDLSSPMRKPFLSTESQPRTAGVTLDVTLDGAPAVTLAGSSAPIEIRAPG
jgi:hypothetical protein